MLVIISVFGAQLGLQCVNDLAQFYCEFRRITLKAFATLESASDSCAVSSCQSSLKQNEKAPDSLPALCSLHVSV